jgi:hypothetical protein
LCWSFHESETIGFVETKNGNCPRAQQETKSIDRQRKHALSKGAGERGEPLFGNPSLRPVVYNIVKQQERQKSVLVKKSVINFIIHYFPPEKKKFKTSPEWSSAKQTKKEKRKV